MKNKVRQHRRNASWHIRCLSPFSPQASVIPPASLVVWEMWAGHAGIRMHHVGQLWRGHWKLCAPAGARTQALLQWRSRAGQLGEQSVITCGVIANTTLGGDSATWRCYCIFLFLSGCVLTGVAIIKTKRIRICQDAVCPTFNTPDHSLLFHVPFLILPLHFLLPNSLQ